MLSGEAEQLILAGDAKSGMRVTGYINLSNKHLPSLPEDLTSDVLCLDDCHGLSGLPSGLKLRRLLINRCMFSALPADLECYELQWHECPLREWPKVEVKHLLDLSESPNLEVLPEGLKVGTLRLTDCTELKRLPEGIDAYFLDMRGCTQFEHWPSKGSVRFGRLNVRDCIQLGSLPKWLTHVGQLDLRGCSNITELPEKLEVSSWIDIGGTRIRTLPESVDERCLRWRGVPVEKRIVFDAKSITADEILDEDNVERRRVLLELMGYEPFFKAAKATVLDTDTDRGGERKLLHVPMKGDEDLVCVSVICPSTGHQYIIRVPPDSQTCKQAVAWIAGFDNADDYALITET